MWTAFRNEIMNKENPKTMEVLKMGLYIFVPYENEKNIWAVPGKNTMTTHQIQEIGKRLNLGVSRETYEYKRVISKKECRNCPTLTDHFSGLCEICRKKLILRNKNR